MPQSNWEMIIDAQHFDNQRHLFLELISVGLWHTENHPNILKTRVSRNSLTTMEKSRLSRASFDARTPVHHALPHRSLVDTMWGWSTHLRTSMVINTQKHSLDQVYNRPRRMTAASTDSYTAHQKPISRGKAPAFVSQLADCFSTAEKSRCPKVTTCTLVVIGLKKPTDTSKHGAPICEQTHSFYEQIMGPVGDVLVRPVPWWVKAQTETFNRLYRVVLRTLDGDLIKLWSVINIYLRATGS